MMGISSNLGLSSVDASLMPVDASISCPYGETFKVQLETLAHELENAKQKKINFAPIRQ